MGNRLALGTVQFGLPYGISNTHGQVAASTVTEILEFAASAGVDTLDTAIAYGESESVLGRNRLDAFRIVTKLPAVPGDADVSNWIAEQVQGSLQRLGVNRLGAVLLHRPEQLLDANGTAIWRALLDLRESGAVEKVGISVYAPDALDRIGVPYDLVQAPYSVFDQRMATSGWLGRLSDAGVEFHARSVFLQGLLLLAPERRPAKFGAWGPAWTTWDGWLAESGLTPLEACLRFALARPEIGRIVVGVEGVAHVREVLAGMEGSMPALPGQLSTLDPFLLNPSNW